MESVQAPVAVGVRVRVLVETGQTSWGEHRFEPRPASRSLYCAEEARSGFDGVGLGGDTGSTNIVTPLVSVSPTSAMDHMENLGTPFPNRAEKAGIIMRDVPVISGRNLPKYRCDPRGGWPVRALCVGREAPERKPPPWGRDRTSTRAPGAWDSTCTRLQKPPAGGPALEAVSGPEPGCALGRAGGSRRQARRWGEADGRQCVRDETPGCRGVWSSLAGPVVYADGAHNPNAARRLRSSGANAPPGDLCSSSDCLRISLRTSWVSWARLRTALWPRKSPVSRGLIPWM